MSKKKTTQLNLLKQLILDGYSFQDTYETKQKVYSFLKSKNNDIEQFKQLSEIDKETLIMLAIGLILEHSDTPKTEENLIVTALANEPYLAFVIVNSFDLINTYHLYKQLDIELNYIEKLEKARKLTRAEKKKKAELVKMYRGLCKYKEIYETTNLLRRQGITVDKALKQAIEVNKENIFVKELVNKFENRIDEIVDYLHNSYYKTKYKDFNNFP